MTIVVNIFRWGLSLILFGWGMFTIDSGSLPWLVIGIIVFSLPCLAQLSRRTSIQVGAIWFAMLLALQCGLGVFFPPPLATGQPHQKISMDFDREFSLVGMHGIHWHSTDEQGFRVTSKIDYPQKHGLRILTVGASTTACDFLDDKKTWPALLEKKLRDQFPGRNIEVINAGVNGSRIRNQHAMLEHILQFQPDMVIFLLGVNDWNYQIKDSLGNKNFKLRELLKLKYSPVVAVTNRILGRSGQENRGESNIIAPGETKVLHQDPYQELRGSLFRSQKIEFYPPKVSSHFSHYLSSMVQTCRDKNVRCVFLTQPTAYSPNSSKEMQSLFWMTPFLEDYTVTYDSLLYLQRIYNQYVIDTAAQNGMAALDLAKEIEPSSRNFVDDVHFNEAGAENVAQSVSKFLNSHGEMLK